MALHPNDPYSPVQSVVPETQVPNDYVRADASPASFGGQIGAAEQGVNQGAERLASGLTDVAVQVQGIQNRTAIDDGYKQGVEGSHTILYGDPSNPDDHGFFGLRGADAMNARGPTLQKLENLQNRISGGMQNEQQQAGFNDSFRRAMLLMSGQINSHADQQFSTWADQTQAANQDLALKGLGAAPNDEAAFQHNLDVGMQAAAKRMVLQGASTDTINAAQLDFRNKAYATRAEAMGATDPVAALNFVTTNESKMDGSTFAVLTER